MCIYNNCLYIELKNYRNNQFVIKVHGNLESICQLLYPENGIRLKFDILKLLVTVLVCGD